MGGICNAGLKIVITLAAIAWFPFTLLGSGNGSGKDEPQPVPPDIQAIFHRPGYVSATWGLRVMDLKSGRVILDLNQNRKFYIGSVRKAFVLAEMLNQVGADRHFDTPEEMLIRMCC